MMMIVKVYDATYIYVMLRIQDVLLNLNAANDKNALQIHKSAEHQEQRDFLFSDYNGQKNFIHVAELGPQETDNIFGHHKICMHAQDI